MCLARSAGGRRAHSTPGPRAPRVLGGGDCARRAAVLCCGHSVCSELGTASRGGRRSRRWGGGRARVADPRGREKGSGLCLGM